MLSAVNVAFLPGDLGEMTIRDRAVLSIDGHVMGGAVK